PAGTGNRNSGDVEHACEPGRTAHVERLGGALRSLWEPAGASGGGIHLGVVGHDHVEPGATGMDLAPLCRIPGGWRDDRRFSTHTVQSDGAAGAGGTASGLRRLVSRADESVHSVRADL